jgi:two-component system, OmpR family, sensor kinase
MIVLFCGVSCVLLAGASIVLYILLQTEVKNSGDEQLLQIARPLHAEINVCSRPESISQLSLPGEYFEVLDPQGKVRRRSANLSGSPLQITLPPEDSPSPSFQRISDERLGSLAVALISFNCGHELSILAVAIPSRSAQILEDFRQLIVLLVPVGLLFTGVTAAWYVGKSLKPIRDLTQRAAEATDLINDPQRYGPGISLRIDNPFDEVGQLASSFNQLFARMGGIVNQMRQFVTDASHELRTPLSILQGETELVLSADRSAAEYRQTLTILETELKQLTSIVDALFTLSMADAGELQVLRDPLYLNELVLTSCKLVHSRATSKNIRVLPNVPSQPVPYLGDESFLRQLFIDLLDNAIKYSPPASSIRVTLTITESGIQTDFQDEGIGIAENDQQWVFERFYRVQATSREGQSGGLGLAIARAIVRAHQGTISLTSQLGRGSTFTVLLPFIDDNLDAQAGASQPSPPIDSLARRH